MSAASAIKSGDKTANLLLILAIGGVALYALSKFSKVAGAAIDASASGIADAITFWEQLGSGAPIQVLGNVVLPSGTVVTISSLQWRQDNQGNAYTNVGGSVYELAARDSNGNFTLSQVA